MYPEETYFREHPPAGSARLCHSWEIQPSLSQDGVTMAVCLAHLNTPFSTNPASVLSNYPGPNIDHWLAQKNFNYRERPCLLPVKVMSQIARGRSRNHNYCGHYEQTGTSWSEHNVEFTQMLYGGMMGSPIIRGIMTDIDQDKVRRLFTILQSINPLLRRFKLPEIRQENQRNILHTITRMNQTVPDDNAWIHNHITSIDNTDSIAAQYILDDLIVGLDSNNNQLSFRDQPAILALIFPYHFTEGRGYYSLCSPQDNQTNELQGGYADANQHFTISKYVKQLILGQDIRFGKCIEILFFMLDFIEKNNIHSAQRFVIPVQAGRAYRRRDVHDGQHHLMNTVSLVPHTIRSSRAIKKRHGMNLFVSLIFHFFYHCTHFFLNK